MSPIATSVYTPVTVTPRQTSAMTLSGWSLICLPATALLHATPTQLDHAGAGESFRALCTKVYLGKFAGGRWPPWWKQRPAAFVLAHIGTTSKEAILLAGHFLRLVAPGTVPACRSAISPSGRRAPGQRKVKIGVSLPRPRNNQRNGDLCSGPRSLAGAWPGTAPANSAQNKNKPSRRGRAFGQTASVPLFLACLRRTASLILMRRGVT